MVLAILFTPLMLMEHIGTKPAHPAPDGNRQAFNLTHMLFFVVSLVLCIKIFCVFWYGYLDTPRVDEVMLLLTSEDPKMQKDGRPKLERAKTHRYQFQDDTTLSPDDLNTRPFAAMFKRIAATMAVCECLGAAGLLIVTLTQGTAHFIHSSAAGLFALTLYAVVHHVWDLAVLFGSNRHWLDGVSDVISVIPILCMLGACIRHRAVEVAGRRGLPPTWVQSLFVACIALVFAEFLLVLINSHFHETVQKTPSRDPEQPEARDGKQPRSDHAKYIATRSFIRTSVTCVVGCLLFSLHWMTDAMCSPK
jgi:hypothetical protein